MLATQVMDISQTRAQEQVEQGHRTDKGLPRAYLAENLPQPLLLAQLWPASRVVMRVFRHADLMHRANKCLNSEA